MAKTGKEEAIGKLKAFLQESFPNIQAFDSASIHGDLRTEVYDADGITVLWCEGWNYIEIFGLSRKEFASLLAPKDNDLNWFGDHLRTFGKDETEPKEGQA